MLLIMIINIIEQSVGFALELAKNSTKLNRIRIMKFQTLRLSRPSENKLNVELKEMEANPTIVKHVRALAKKSF